MDEQEPALPPASPRTDGIAAGALIAFGAFVAVTSWRMDRLDSQGGTIWTAPGLWPGIIGACIVALGALLVLRSIGRARQFGWYGRSKDDTPLVPTGRFALAAAMFFVFGLVLVGRGIPFWLGTAIFVSAYIYLFREAPAGASRARNALVAIAIGAATSLIVTGVFERVFLVRLP
jgi:putative tricarboxylic transport membrane protein